MLTSAFQPDSESCRLREVPGKVEFFFFFLKEGDTDEGKKRQNSVSMHACGLCEQLLFISKVNWYFQYLRPPRGGKIFYSSGEKNSAYMPRVSLGRISVLVSNFSS